MVTNVAQHKIIDLLKTKFASLNFADGMVVLRCILDANINVDHV